MYVHLSRRYHDPSVKCANSPIPRKLEEACMLAQVIESHAHTDRGFMHDILGLLYSHSDFGTIRWVTRSLSMS